MSISSILYVSPRFPAHSNVFQQNEILGLINGGANVVVLSCRRRSQKDIDEIHEFARPILGKTRYPGFWNSFAGLLSLLTTPNKLVRMLNIVLTDKSPQLILKNLTCVLVALSFYRKAKSESYDWIHADFGQGSATMAFALSQLLDLPFSFKVHAFDIYDRRFHGANQTMEKKAAAASAIFSAHDFGRKLLVEQTQVDEAKTCVNYVTIRADEFAPVPFQNDSKRFIALGRLVEKKGFHVLVDAAAELKKRNREFQVDIFGSGEQEELLRKKVAEANLHEVVHLPGRYENSRLPQMLSDCVALLAPSVEDKNGDMDGIPTVLLEAMALGRAVIASSLSGIPELVKNNVNGYLVTPDDPIELADRMEALLDSPDLAAKYGIAGSEFVRSQRNYVDGAKQLLTSMGDRINYDGFSS